MNSTNTNMTGTQLQMRRWNLFHYLGIAAFAGCLCYAGYWYSIQTRAARNLFAAQTATNALLAHMAEFHEWPRSVEDLKRVNAENAYRWPDDAVKVLDRVSIRFAIPIQDIANSSPDDFAYLTVQGPVYQESFRAKVRMLIRCARDVEIGFGDTSR